MNDDHFSTDHEPALSGGRFEPDPAEWRADAVEPVGSDAEALRDSVAAEPALPQHGDPQHFNAWLRQRREACTPMGDLAVTITAAVLGGPFAVVGALMAGRQGLALIYVIVFGPVIEELLKQSGMTYVLEKKPYRVFAAWQFVFAGLLSGLTFAVIENLVYVEIYARAAEVKDVAAMAAFRWAVCTPLHVVCSGVASLGLVRVWRRQQRLGGPADLSAAFPWFAVAMAVHGLYNFGATFVRF